MTDISRNRHEDADALAAVKLRLKQVFGRWTRDTTLEEMRADFEALLRTDRTAPTEELSISGVPACRITPTGADPERTILFFHGGGYQMGSCASHRDLMIRMGQACRSAVIGFDYRLAPEHRFPAAFDDAYAVASELLAQMPDTTRLVFAGDSAGGGLALATLVALRQAGAPMPGGCVLLSPWLDMRARGESYETRAALDPMTQRDKVLLMARAYLGRSGDPDDPRASPLMADLGGLPPILIHVGDHETVLDDARGLAQRAAQAGTPATLRVWDRMIHHFQIFDSLPETAESLAEIARFLDGVWAAEA